jgi:hypothetical protein
MVYVRRCKCIVSKSCARRAIYGVFLLNLVEYTRCCWNAHGCCEGHYYSSERWDCVACPVSKYYAYYDGVEKLQLTIMIYIYIIL